MKIRCRDNRTRKYLFPILNTYGSTFIKQLDSLTNYITGYPISHSILEMGISDVIYYKAKNINLTNIKNHPYLFVVFDMHGIFKSEKNTHLNSKEGKERFFKFLAYIRTNKRYIDDYWYNEKQHCIVFSLEEFFNAYSKFIESKYSEMYTPEEFKLLKIPQFQYQGEKKFYVPEYAVLNKIPDVGSTNLKNKIYENYGVDTLPDNPKEYDIPWFVEEEFLNAKYLAPQILEEFIDYKRQFQ